MLLVCKVDHTNGTLSGLPHQCVDFFIAPCSTVEAFQALVLARPLLQSRKLRVQGEDCFARSLGAQERKRKRHRGPRSI